jgi:hypothetical protein
MSAGESAARGRGGERAGGDGGRGEDAGGAAEEEGGRGGRGMSTKVRCDAEDLRNSEKRSTTSTTRKGDGVGPS